VIVQFDSDAKISLSGFDLKNGDTKWETIRKGRPVWSSPVLATFDNQVQVLINGNPDVTSFDPATGKELWSQPGVTNDVVPSLAVNSKMVFAVTDYARLVALKPGQNGSKVWDDNTFTPEASSPVATDKYLFVTTGNGDAACYNAEKGDTLWSHYFENPFYASPIVCDNKVWMLDRNGIMHIVEEGSKFKIISTSPIGEKSDCTPAFSEKKIYVRGKDNLYCVGVN
jgi:outer membrane protein assembly factor BamB